MKEKRNAFRPAVLAAVEKLDGPATLSSSAFAGPWEVVLTPDGWEPRKDGWTVQSLGGGTVAAVSDNFETAALIASVLPLESRPAAYDISGGGDREPEIKMTFASSGHQTVARFAGFLPGIEEAMEAAHLVASCPRSLAWIMAAASPDTLTRAGEILMEILEKRAEDQRAIDRSPLEPRGPG